MKHDYDPRLAKELMPLLESIGREITERSVALENLEAEIERHALQDGPGDAGPHGLIAEAAAHRRGLRLSRQELERLGCSVVGTDPLTLRIPGRVGTTKRSFVWQAGDPALR